MPEIVKEDSTVKYPCLMESKQIKDYIVYFTEEGQGIVLHDPHDNGLFFRGYWDMKTFTPFKGKVVFP